MNRKNVALLGAATLAATVSAKFGPMTGYGALKNDTMGYPRGKNQRQKRKAKRQRNDYR